MFVICLPAILGPEMAAPILWAAWDFLVLSAGKPPCPKDSSFRAGSGFFWKGGGGVGGQSRVNLSFGVFPCFAMFGGPKIPRCWEKQHEKCQCHTHFLCAPNASNN